MPIIRNRIPDKGGVENMMQRLQSYIEPVDPEWAKKLKPASEESIKKWKKVLTLEEKQLDFPSSYLEFLQYAGEGDGGLFEETLNAKMSLESQLLYCRNVDINERDITHPYCFKFMVTTDLNLPYSINLGKENEKIFCDMSVEVSNCFENLLFQCAIERYEKHYFSSYEMIRPGKKFADFDYSKQGRDLFRIIDRIAKINGLRRAWFSDDSVYFAYSDEMSLFIVSRDYGGLGMIFYDKKEKVENIRKNLLSDINAIIY